MDPYNPLTDDARQTVSTLLASPHAALATTLDGAPFVTRAACLWIAGTGLTLLLSDLSEHARALASDPACSVLMGEPGPKGDPLTHARITLVGRAVEVDKPSHAAAWRKGRPKTALYYDFTDFRLWHLNPTHGLLNAGFGKAYRLAPSDITSGHHNAP